MSNPQPRARAQDWEQIITGILRGSSLDRNKEYTERFWNNCGLSIDRLRAASAEQANEIEQAYGYLSRLFKHLAPQCEPISKLIGLVTQIDNLIAGDRIKIAEQAKTIERLREALSNIAKQKFGAEMDEEEVESGDFEGAYDFMIEDARKALAETAKGAT